MLRKTGPGKVDELLTGSPITKTLLYNFDFESDAAKPEHTAWLDNNLVERALMPQYKVWMRGTASQVGDPGYNLKLSKRRAKAIESHLISRGVDASRIQTEWKGEFLSESLNKDDDRDRAVEIHLQGAVKQTPAPPPKPPVTPPPAPPTSDSFRLRILGGAQVSKAIDVGKWLARVTKAAKLRKIPKIGPAADFAFIEIQDVKNSRSGFYLYTGAGVGGGAYWMSSSHIGPWNRFTTSKPILVSEFDGPARLDSAGFLKWSLTYIDLLGTPPGVRRVHMSISTGLTIGLGISTTAGACIFLDSAKASP